MTSTVNVEKDELLARAAELEQAMPPVPPVVPVPVCALALAKDAATQLSVNVDTMRTYLKAWEREWKRLAQSLRNAAAAYEDTDDAAAEAIGELSASSKSIAANGDTMSMFCDPDEDYVPVPPPKPPPPPPTPYYPVRDAVNDIRAADQGIAFLAFADAWHVYQRDQLQSTLRYFRPFEYWDGLAVITVEANFALHRSYVKAMTGLCKDIAKQATDVVAAHRWALTEHPEPYDVVACDNRWKQLAANPEWHQYLPDVTAWYEALQKKSEEVLAEYMKKGTMPLAQVYPDNPPTSIRIDAPPKPPPKPGDPDYEGPDDGNPDDGNPDDGLPDDGIPDDGIPDDGGTDDELPAIPSNPSGAAPPSVPPSGIPSMDDAALASALDELKSSGADVGAGMKPASVGGGGGGGVPGMPAMPLQPAVEAEGVRGGASGAAGRPDLGSLARGASPGMGGGGPMGMPMGAGAGAGGQGGDGKSKRIEGTEEALYTEDREWTEGIIGRRRNDGKDTK